MFILLMSTPFQRSVAGSKQHSDPSTVIYFDWDGDGVADHAEIVESYEGSIVYTIERNANNACKQLSHAVGDQRTPWHGVISK